MSVYEYINNMNAENTLVATSGERGGRRDKIS